jgi:hypothetical protein
VAGFFDMDFMFNIKDGFDIVIGNPPYLSYYSKSQNIAYETRDFVNTLKEHYSYIQNKKAKGRLNSMNFFIEKGILLLKNNGIEFFILDITLNEKASFDIRKYIVDNFSLNEIIFGISVFENVTSDQILLSIKKEKNINKSFFWRQNLDIKPYSISQAYIKSNNYSFYYSKFNVILESMEHQTMLEEIVDHTIGVQIGGKNLIYNDKPIKDLFYSEFEIENSYKNISEINKYQIPKSSNYLIFDVELGKNINRCVKDANIALPNNIPFINKEKIILRQSASKFIATIAPKDTVGEHKFFFFKIKDSKQHNVNMSYILAIINSKLLTFYGLQRNIIKVGDKKQPQIRIKEVIKIPIAIASNSVQKLFNKLVDYIIFLKQQDFNQSDDLKFAKDRLMVAFFERLIDCMVYELYFADELHKENKYFIEPLQKESLMDMQNMDNKLEELRAIFEKLNDKNHTIKKNMYFIDSVEVVRIIEGKENANN